MNNEIYCAIPRERTPDYLEIMDKDASPALIRMLGVCVNTSYDKDKVSSNILQIKHLGEEFQKKTQYRVPKYATDRLFLLYYKKATMKALEINKGHPFFAQEKIAQDMVYFNKDLTPIHMADNVILFRSLLNKYQKLPGFKQMNFIAGKRRNVQQAKNAAMVHRQHLIDLALKIDLQEGNVVHKDDPRIVWI